MMKGERSASVVGGMRRLFGGGAVHQIPERDLLDRFLVQADHGAFEAIVARHGPMVAAIFRSILPDPADADDAFQATFVVLVLRAGTIRDGAKLSPWLHGVARRVALRAKARRSRRQDREGGHPDALLGVAAPAGLDAERRELAASVRAELGRLPAAEQLAITACDLEGLSHREAADRLGWPLGTVKARVGRGRARLRGRLARRGLTVGDPALVATLAGRAPAVARGLVEATTRAALAVAAGRAGSAGITPAAPRELTAATGRGMGLAPGKLVAGALAAALTALATGGWIASRASVPPPSPVAPLPHERDDPNQAVAPGSIRFDRVVVDADFPGAAQVEVADVDGDGKPDLVVVGGTTVAWYQNPTWTKRIIAAGGDPIGGEVSSSATVDLDHDGRAEVAIACDFARDTPTRGQLYLARPGATFDAPWTCRKIQDVPSIHRVRWGDIDGDRQPELIVAPFCGPNARPPAYEQDPARVVALRPGPADPQSGPWAERAIGRRSAVRAIDVTPFGSVAPWGGKRPVTVTTADITGLSTIEQRPDRHGKSVWWEAPSHKLVIGASGSTTGRGCHDFRLAMSPDGHPCFVTIEPGHKPELVLWEQPKVSPPASDAEQAVRTVMTELKALGDRLASRPIVLMKPTVLDDTLGDANALWTADVDGDGGDELFAGDRGPKPHLALYRRVAVGWGRTIIDHGLAPAGLCGGDLDGDGRPDVVAVGGGAAQVVWYRPGR